MSVGLPAATQSVTPAAPAAEQQPASETHALSRSRASSSTSTTTGRARASSGVGTVSSSTQQPTVVRPEASPISSQENEAVQSEELNIAKQTARPTGVRCRAVAPTPAPRPVVEESEDADGEPLDDDGDDDHDPPPPGDDPPPDDPDADAAEPEQKKPGLQRGQEIAA